MDVKREAAGLLQRLASEGLLLAHDATLPSATALLAGSPIKGSWWGHPKGSLIFHALGAVEDDVLFVKLVSGKVTMVDRRLWPAVIAVASSRDPWQTDLLPDDARMLLKKVERDGEVRTDQLVAKARKPGAVAADLERRLLVHATDVHTEGGHHARVLQTWDRFRKRARIAKKDLPRPAEARALLAAPVERWVGKARAAKLLPW